MYDSWYINIEEETFGPLSTDAVSVMLKQNRVHFSDFIWKQTFSTWVRIIDVRVFAPLLPPIPKINPPAVGDELELSRIPEVTPRNIDDLKSSTDKKPTKLRYFPRAVIDGHIEIDEIGSFKLADISEVGVFVSAMNLIELNTQIDFTLKTDLLGDSKMSGIVIRHSVKNETPGFAIQFVKIDKAYQDKIHNFILSEQMRKR